ncbi:MAG TPA: c(7)-type cytochrome triheme domain-containing protein [Geobacteraceae bacterium]
MRMIITALILLLATAAVVSADSATSRFDLPPLPAPEEYGNLLIDRTVSLKGGKPHQAVTFSHWLHRQRHTCRVCHGELPFAMKRNSTEITMQEIRNGKLCGACHHKKAWVAFGPDGNCEKCHNNDIGYGREKFQELLNQPYPEAQYGNGIDWVAALAQRLFKPRAAAPLVNAQDKPQPKAKRLQFDKQLLLEAEWSSIPPAIFPHQAHVQWLDCDNCHPDIFVIQKKKTHFAMTAILNGEYCGVCHMTVAFPMNDCRRCHPGMRQG